MATFTSASSTATGPARRLRVATLESARASGAAERPRLGGAGVPQPATANRRAASGPTKLG
jgi:hypothetical protein